MIRVPSPFVLARIALCATVALCLSASPTASQDIEPPQAAAPAVADPALWVVRDADSTLYLFGTLHFLRPGVTWRSAEVASAMEAADAVYLEIAGVEDIGAATAAIRRHGMAPADQPLSTLLTEADRARLDAAASALGGSAAAFEADRPWWTAVKVSVAAIVRAGYDPASGVDPQIKQAAVAAGKPVRGLETMEQQFGFFAGLPVETQVDFLRQALDTYEDAPTELDQMVAAWSTGDVERLDRVVLAEMKARWGDVYQVLLVDRNADWAGQIQTMLEGSGVTFIAVGAAHLAGEDSVQSMLAARGVTVERL